MFNFNFNTDKEIFFLFNFGFLFSRKYACKKKFQIIFAFKIKVGGQS